jgi:hypothetical protein
MIKIQKLDTAVAGSCPDKLSERSLRKVEMNKAGYRNVIIGRKSFLKSPSEILLLKKKYLPSEIDES